MELPEVHRAVSPVLELDGALEALEGELATVAVGVAREVDGQLGLAEQVVAAFHRAPEQKSASSICVRR